MPVSGQRSHSIAVAAGILQMLILWGFKEIPWNEKRRSLVKFLARINVTRILTFYCYKLSDQIDAVLRTVRKIISCRSLIRNCDINSISSLTTTSSSSTLRTIKKFSNRILIQAPSYSIFEACDSLQDYSEESTVGRHCNSGALQKDRKDFGAKF